MVSKTFSFPRSDFIGFDHIWNDIERLSTFAKEKSYPPHNVVKYTETEYSIELALAGYKKEDLSIEVKEGILIVSGDGRSTLDEAVEKEYLWNGISAKKFKRTFRLSEHVVVDGADFIDGLLVINLKVVVPEEKLPRKIPIGDTKFLTEERANDHKSTKKLW